MKTLIAIPVFNEESTVEAVVRARAGARRARAAHRRRIDRRDRQRNRTRPRAHGPRSDPPRGQPGVRPVPCGPPSGAPPTAASTGSSRWTATSSTSPTSCPRSSRRSRTPTGRARPDIISGSRYLDPTLDPIGEPPGSRRAINRTITRELNERLGLSLTDGFCGFKAHRVASTERLALTEEGYAFPMQLWVQLVATGATDRRAPHPADLQRSRTGPSGAGSTTPGTGSSTTARSMHTRDLCTLGDLPAGAGGGIARPLCCRDENLRGANTLQPWAPRCLTIRPERDDPACGPAAPRSPRRPRRDRMDRARAPRARRPGRSGAPWACPMTGRS
jgi:hypothetical protein